MTGQDVDQGSNGAAKPRRLLRRVFRPRNVLRALRGLIMLPILFGVIAGLGMLGQEITAPSWVKHRVEDQARLVLGGGSLHFGAVTVTLAPDLHPVVRLRDARLEDRSGAVLARFPLIESTVSPRGLLLRRAVMPQEVRIDSALFQMRRDEDGRFALDLGGDVVAAEWPSVAGALAMFDDSFEHPAISALRHVEVTNLRMRFDDRQSGLRHRVDGGRLDVNLTGGVTRIAAALDVHSNGAEGAQANARSPTALRFDYQSPRASRVARFELDLKGAPSRDVAALAPAMRWLGLVDAPLSLSLQAGLDADGDLSPATVRLSMGTGRFVQQSGEETLGFQRAALDFGYDFTSQVFDFTRVFMDSDWGAISASGGAVLEDVAPSGLPNAIVAQLAFAGTALNPAAALDGPVALPPAQVDMRLRFDPLRVEIADLSVTPSGDGQSGLLRAQADVELKPDGWQVAVDAQLDRISTDRLLAVWPVAFNKGARDWFASHVHGGSLTDVAVAFRVAPDERPTFAYSHDFSDADVTMVRGLPPVLGARGHSSLQDNAFNVFIAEGQVEPAQGGIVEMAGSAFTIGNMAIRPMTAQVSLETQGSVTGTMALLDSAPFNLISRTPVPVDVAEGQAQVNALLTFPLMAGIGLADVAYDGTATLSDVVSTKLIPNQILTADRLDLDLRDGGLTIAGDARIGPAAVSGIFSVPFRDSRPRFDGTARLTPEVLAHFAPVLPAGSLTGAAEADVALTFHDGIRLEIRSTMEGAGLSVPQIGWRKAPSTAGELALDIRLGAVPQIESLRARFGDFRADGRINLTSGGLRDATFTRLAVGSWLDAPVVLQPQTGGLHITTQGGSVDIRGAVAALGGGGSGGAGTGGTRLTLSLDRLNLTDSIILTGFRGDFLPQSGGMGGTFTGAVNGLAPVEGTFVMDGGAPSIRVTGRDAGRVLQAAGIFANAEGGAFGVTITPAGRAGEYNGQFVSDTVRVYEAPALASLLNAVSVVGLIQQMSGQGLVFDEVLADFRISPDRVTVLRSSAVGPGLGISLDGVYRLDGGVMDFQGVLSPFYFFNAVGAILTRRGEGLFGFNFTLQGPVSAMQVGVNPLSVLTPGMFREIFRRPPPVVD